jgi:hypothetical protein
MKMDLGRTPVDLTYEKEYLVRARLALITQAVKLHLRSKVGGLYNRTLQG